MRKSAGYFAAELNFPQRGNAWCLDTVSTTCGSGWVRGRRNQIRMAAHPPATAGGTDRVQAWRPSLEARGAGLRLQHLREGVQ